MTKCKCKHTHHTSHTHSKYTHHTHTRKKEEHSRKEHSRKERARKQPSRKELSRNQGWNLGNTYLHGALLRTKKHSRGWSKLPNGSLVPHSPPLRLQCSTKDVCRERAASSRTAPIPTTDCLPSFALLPSGRRYRALRSWTSRFRNSFFPAAVTLLNPAPR